MAGNGAALRWRRKSNRSSKAQESKEATTQRRLKLAKKRLRACIKEACKPLTLARHQTTWTYSNNYIIKVCSDCAGVGAEVLALRLCGVKRIRTVAWSERDEKKVALHNAVHAALGQRQVGELCKDMETRNHAITPPSDLYVAGFPCPSFSSAGLRLGVGDPSGRGLLAFHGLEYICEHRPRVVLLENVKGMLQQRHRSLRKTIWKCLRALGYSVQGRVLNTKDHGVPQNRPRFYIIGIRDPVHEFEWPMVLPWSFARLHHYIEKTKTGQETLDIASYERQLGREVWTKGYILDVGASEAFRHGQRGCCPCLTRARLGGKLFGYYIPKLRRRLSLLEASRLQGVPDEVCKTMLTAVGAEGKVGQALGDMMSINVLMRLLPRALEAAGLLSPGEVRDHWETVGDGDAASLPSKLFRRHVLGT